MLKLGIYMFEDDLTSRENCLMFFPADEDEGASWSVDCAFLEGVFGDLEVSPAICINPIETEAESVEELVGTTFSVETVEECDEREDLFTVYEMEPMQRYEIRVLEVANDHAHVVGKGIAIVDGFDEEAETEEFSFDVWLPIIVDKDDWEKFGL